MSWAFVITTFIRRINELDMLIECIHNIRVIYPTKTIYVLDDYSIIPVSNKIQQKFQDSQIFVYKTFSPQGGEINPYLFMLSKECRHPTLVFIHDSCTIHHKIDSFVNDTEYILFLWTAQNDAFYMNVSDYNIKNKMIINNNSVAFLLKKYKYCNRSLCFGGMSIFTRKFADLLRDKTNFFAMTYLFKTRDQRCFFERIIFFMAKELIPNFSNKSLQGNIYDHPNSFNNTDIYANKNNYFTKIWLGR
jgi:hypothetical protein